MKNLKKISLQLNKISNISSELFAGVYELEEIELQFNQIKLIGSRAFASLKYLTKVYLQQIVYTDVEDVFKFTFTF